MTKSLIADIKTKLFVNDSKHVVILFNRDCFFERDDVVLALQYSQVEFAKGNSLDLRVIWETEWKTSIDKKCVFLMQEEFEILEDISCETEFLSFQIKSMFRFYHWDTIKNESLATLEWLYNQPQLLPLDRIKTRDIVSEYASTVNRVDEAMNEIKHDLNMLMTKPNFNRPSEWLPDVSRLLLKSLELERWEEVSE